VAVGVGAWVGVSAGVAVPMSAGVRDGATSVAEGIIVGVGGVDHMEAVGVAVMLGGGGGCTAPSHHTSAGRSAAVHAPSPFASAWLHVLASKSAPTTAARSALRLRTPSQSASPGNDCTAQSAVGTQSCWSATSSSNLALVRLFMIVVAAPGWAMRGGCYPHTIGDAGYFLPTAAQSFPIFILKAAAAAPIEDGMHHRGGIGGSEPVVGRFGVLAVRGYALALHPRGSTAR